MKEEGSDSHREAGGGGWKVRESEARERVTER